MKPRILISGNKKIDYYTEAVKYAGGDPTACYLPEVDTSFDGLILCGGNDTHPAYYGEEVNGAVDFDLDRDKRELELLDAFVKAGKPVLGICRGHQLINIYFGGTIIQNLDNAEKHSSFSDYDLVHEITVKKGSVLNGLYCDRFSVNSFHHQAVKELGKGLYATAFSGDVIEAVEHTSGKIFGVQFHPERMCASFRSEVFVDGLSIFEHFISLL